MATRRATGEPWGLVLSGRKVEEQVEEPGGLLVEQGLVGVVGHVTADHRLEGHRAVDIDQHIAHVDRPLVRCLVVLRGGEQVAGSGWGLGRGQLRSEGRRLGRRQTPPEMDAQPWISDEYSRLPVFSGAQLQNVLGTER